MCELKKWMKKNKKFYVVTGIFGLLVSPFLWPFFLAIIFQSLSLAVPIILVCLFIKQPWREEEEQDEEVCKRVWYGKDADPEKVSPDDAQTDDIPQSREEKRQKPVDAQETGKEKNEPDEESCLALLWYQKEGRERILRMKEKLDKEGKKEFSISKEGICSVRKEKGFQRIGVLRGYPGNRILFVAKELKKDGLSINPSGDYVWISWKKGGMKHAL